MTDHASRSIERQAFAGDLEAQTRWRRARIAGQTGEESTLWVPCEEKLCGFGVFPAGTSIKGGYSHDCRSCQGTGKRVLSWRAREELLAYVGDEMARAVAWEQAASVCANCGFPPSESPRPRIGQCDEEWLCSDECEAEDEARGCAHEAIGDYRKRPLSVWLSGIKRWGTHVTLMAASAAAEVAEKARFDKRVEEARRYVGDDHPMVWRDQNILRALKAAEHYITDPTPEHREALQAAAPNHMRGSFEAALWQLCYHGPKKGATRAFWRLLDESKLTSEDAMRTAIQARLRSYIN